jgi:hypothetical protein
VSAEAREDADRVAELERRIDELDSLDESAFGAFTAWDWLACTVFAVVLPALALWWFAG